MSNSLCPVCKIPLSPTHSCSRCSGKFLSISTLSQIAPADFRSHCVAQVNRNGKLSQRLCPQCRKHMKVVRVNDEASPIELDFCLPCFLVWFDVNEINSLPQKGASKNRFEEEYQKFRKASDGKDPFQEKSDYLLTALILTM